MTVSKDMSIIPVWIKLKLGLKIWAVSKDTSEPVPNNTYCLTDSANKS